MTDISCGVVYKATLASLVLFRSYCYVQLLGQHKMFIEQDKHILLLDEILMKICHAVKIRKFEMAQIVRNKWLTM